MSPRVAALGAPFPWATPRITAGALLAARRGHGPAPAVGV